jgi:hypothetical protein
MTNLNADQQGTPEPSPRLAAGVTGTVIAGDASHSRIPFLDIRGWIVVAWVVWWSVAYIQTALAQRFPQLIAWTRSMW